MIETLRKAEFRNWKLIIEGIENQDDKSFLADQLKAVSVPKTVYIQGFGMEC